MNRQNLISMVEDNGVRFTRDQQESLKEFIRTGLITSTEELANYGIGVKPTKVERDSYRAFNRSIH